VEVADPPAGYEIRETVSTPPAARGTVVSRDEDDPFVSECTVGIVGQSVEVVAGLRSLRLFAEDMRSFSIERRKVEIDAGDLSLTIVADTRGSRDAWMEWLVAAGVAPPREWPIPRERTRPSRPKTLAIVLFVLFVTVIIVIAVVNDNSNRARVSLPRVERSRAVGEPDSLAPIDAPQDAPVLYTTDFGNPGAWPHSSDPSGTVGVVDGAMEFDAVGDLLWSRRLPVSAPSDVRVAFDVALAGTSKPLDAGGPTVSCGSGDPLLSDHDALFGIERDGTVTIFVGLDLLAFEHAPRAVYQPSGMNHVEAECLDQPGGTTVYRMFVNGTLVAHGAQKTPKHEGEVWLGFEGPDAGRLTARVDNVVVSDPTP